MEAPRADASTSTDDIKGRPLCLFYFSHPFGVLSPEPPTVVCAGAAPPAPAADAPGMRPPVPVPLSVPLPCVVRMGAGSRMPPRTLPPLCMPDLARLVPTLATPLTACWPRAALPPRPSLPPIDSSDVPPSPAPPSPVPHHHHAEKKPKRRACPSRLRPRRDRRPPLAHLARRTVPGCVRGASWLGARALRAALEERARPAAGRAMAPPPPGARPPSPPPREECSPVPGERGVMRAAGGAPSAGLLRRRYSAPEAIMRRYVLAQRRSDSECGGRSSDPSPAPAAGSPVSGGAAAVARDFMRRDALLRRLCAAGAGTAPYSPRTCALTTCACDALSDSTCRLDVSSPAPELEPLVPRCEQRDTPSAATSYELLEIVVSETVSECPRAPRAPPPDSRLDVDLDQYVSCVLTESLRSLSDRLESASASMAGNGLDIIEKEIKVRLRNAAVNTVVHLSPTSNHQIIFGNEELGGREVTAGESLAVSAASHAHRLMQNLFEGAAPPDAHTASASVEVNVTSSEPERGPSPCASLVDSLDEPPSPRFSSDIAPNSARLVDRGETFFVQIGDSANDELESGHVADLMPEKLKKRLHRRHLNREMRAETARRERREEARAPGAEARSRPARTPAAARARLCFSTSVPDQGAPRRLSSNAEWNDRKGRDTSNKSQNENGLRGGDRPPRRVYHKSEIHDSRGRVEILEILEIARSSHGSSETDSDDSPLQMRARRSRIPVPVSEAVSRRAPPPVQEPRPRSGSLRFDRVFDAIPEERSSPGGDSPARRGSVPALPTADTEEAARRARPAAGAPVEFESRGGAQGSRSRGAGASPSSSSSTSRSRVRVSRPSSRAEGGASRAWRGRRSVGTQVEPRGARPRVVVRRAAQPCPRSRLRARSHQPRPAQPPPCTHTDDRDAVAGLCSSSGGGGGGGGGGAWTVTVAGSLGAARPRDLEMRLRFAPPSPRHAPRHPRSPPRTAASASDAHESVCECARALPAPPTPACAAAVRRELDHEYKGGGGGSRGGRSSRGERRRRGCGPGARRDLSVLGCAIAPEPKPRALTSSERSVTRRPGPQPSHRPCACASRLPRVTS